MNICIYTYIDTHTNGSLGVGSGAMGGTNGSFGLPLIVSTADAVAFSASGTRGAGAGLGISDFLLLG